MTKKIHKDKFHIVAKKREKRKGKIRHIKKKKESN